jgi:wyosine [tRNA(Phe)-imidazoG37] synthetase (radical SAM superfamily)
VDETLTSALHQRTRRLNRYVYAVWSRRSGGISIGINLDPQKTCNFDCVYCEVIDRREAVKGRGRPPIAAADVARELEEELASFDRTSPGYAADPVRDIAFAGDGEPSTFPGFLPLAEALFEVRDRRGFHEVPLVLITNGSGLDRASMVEAQDLFARRGGQFWIKLDAGTEAFYRAVCRTAVPFDRVLRNLDAAARRHPVTVQSMFFRWNGAAPTAGEVASWADRLRALRAAGGRLSLVQVYTVARETMEPGVTPLLEDELEGIARAARAAAPDVPVKTFA